MKKHRYPNEPKLKYYKLSTQQKHRLVETLKEKLENVDEIVFAYLHGSFLERESFRDIDVAIWLKRKEKAFQYTVDFSAKLEAEMKIPIDIQVLNEAPLPFKHHVLTKGRLLFSKDENLRQKLADLTIRQYIDLKQLIAAVKEETKE